MQDSNSHSKGKPGKNEGRDPKTSFTDIGVDSSMYQYFHIRASNHNSPESHK